MRFKYILPVFLALLAAQSVKAQSEIQVDILNNFNFGKVAITGWSGSVSIEVANGNFNRLATGDVELKDVGNYSPATIQISQDKRAKNYKLTQIVPPNQVTLTRQSGSQTITISNITYWPVPNYHHLKHNPLTIYLGGTIQLSDYLTNPGGIYNGTMTLTIVYE
jgi:hypothetical protein